MATSPTLKYLDWDSPILGIKCGLIDLGDINPIVKPSILSDRIKFLCENNDFEFITIKVPSYFIESVNPIIKIGASLIDTELSFSYSKQLTSANRYPILNNSKLSFCKEYKSDEFIPLAKEMRFSRFFLDPKISNGKATHLWETSIRNHCEGLKDQLLIAYYNDKPCGIVTLEFQGNDKICLFLVGVLKKYRRKNIAKGMLRTIVNRYAKKYSIHVETQSVNFIAQRLYQSVGFKLESLRYILHYWNKPQ